MLSRCVHLERGGHRTGVPRRSNAWRAVLGLSYMVFWLVFMACVCVVMNMTAAAFSGSWFFSVETASASRCCLCFAERTFLSGFSSHVISCAE